MIQHAIQDVTFTVSMDVVIVARAVQVVWAVVIMIVKVGVKTVAMVFVVQAVGVVVMEVARNPAMTPVQEDVQAVGMHAEDVWMPVQIIVGPGLADILKRQNYKKCLLIIITF